MSSSSGSPGGGGGGASSPGHGHTRSRASRSSIVSNSSNSNNNDNTTNSSSTSTSTSPPTSATKAAAITRQSSMAKKRASLNACTVNGAATTGSTARLSTTLSRRTSNGSNSVNMSRTNGAGISSSSSAGSLATADEDSNLDTDDDELSRLTREQLVALIVRERKEKEETDTNLSSLSTEHATLSEQRADLLKAQAMHDSKLTESYATTERLERELQEYMDSLEGTREALKEAEKTSREAQKRLRDQAELFDSEQTKWNEIEQSLQSQIKQLNDDHQALQATQHARSATSGSSQAAETSEEAQYASKSQTLSPSSPSYFANTLPPTASPTFQIPESTLEELSFLHTRVSVLSSEQTDLQTEITRLSNELEELQRFNSDLQEQNENYEVLLSERMLSGLHLGSFGDSGVGSSFGGIHEDSSLVGSRPTSALDRLDEEEDHLSSSDDEDEILFETSGNGDISTGAVAANITPNRIKRTAKKRQSMMGINGGAAGFDLEAELDRARQEEEEAEKNRAEEKSRKKKERENAARRKANQSTATMADGEPLPGDVESLRKEIKLLRQENKGLSTYVSKILEKIIGIEGFEKVLAVEKDSKPPPTPTTAQTPPPPPTPAKPSAMAININPARPPPLPARTPSSATTFSSIAAPPLSPIGPTPPSLADTKKKNRFSMDWFGASLFKGSSAVTPESQAAAANVTSGTSAPAPGLKPMMLTGGPAQKTPTVEEDEDDRRTRARLQSEMRLLGIDTTSSPATQGGSPGSVKIGSNRSPNQRISSGSGSYPTSPLPPGVPPKGSEHASMASRDSRPELDAARTSGMSEASSGSAGATATETVKIRGHRKRPSASFAPGGVPAPSATGAANEASPRARPVSVGLGLTYSKDSSSTSTWSAGSPSIKGESSDAEDKRSSAASQNSAL